MSEDKNKKQAEDLNLKLRHPVIKFSEDGRSRVFETAEEMKEQIIAYFEGQFMADLPLTIQGLALSLGFNSRQSLLNYEGYEGKDKVPFLDTIKKARLYIENYKVEGALLNQLNPAMVIFDLKNNYGYDDHQTRVVKLEAATDEELDEEIKRLTDRSK